MPRLPEVSNTNGTGGAADAQRVGGSIAAMRVLSHAAGAAGPAAGLAAALLALGLLAACGGGETPPASAGATPVKRFPAPIFDGLSLGMTRAEAVRVRPMRASLTASGKNPRVWLYDKAGDYSVQLTFSGRSESDRLKRIDVHYGREAGGIGPFLARLEGRYGTPEVRRRQAVINSYGDSAHEQYETIWSDADQYVFLTERLPPPGRNGTPAYFLTIKKKELGTTGPPTGYVPPPALDEDGNPVEEQVF